MGVVVLRKVFWNGTQHMSPFSGQKNVLAGPGGCWLGHLAAQHQLLGLVLSSTFHHTCKSSLLWCEKLYMPMKLLSFLVHLYAIEDIVGGSKCWKKQVLGIVLLNKNLDAILSCAFLKSSKCSNSN